MKYDNTVEVLWWWDPLQLFMGRSWLCHQQSPQIYPISHYTYLVETKDAYIQDMRPVNRAALEMVLYGIILNRVFPSFHSSSTLASNPLPNLNPYPHTYLNTGHGGSMLYVHEPSLLKKYLYGLPGDT